VMFVSYIMLGNTDAFYFNCLKPSSIFAATPGL
jgi:hypothetical protein